MELSDAMEDSRDSVYKRSSEYDGLSRPPKVPRVGEPEYVPPCLKVRGSRLMQLFSVRIVDYDPVNMAEIHGIIFLVCAYQPYVLFERFPGDPLPTDPNGFLKLTGPNEAHDAYDCIYFHAYLCDLKSHLRALNETMWYGGGAESRLPCNRLLVNRWDTVIGTVELSYAVFTESVRAALEVNLLDWKDNGKSNGRIAGSVDEIEVFGEITGRVKLITDAEAKSYMFKREKEMCALVRPGEAIPLSRCYMVCPIRSSIEFHVALYHPNLGGDGLIVNDHVEASALHRGDEFVLESDCARLQLKITFVQ